jgi:hypothetical protein
MSRSAIDGAPPYEITPEQDDAAMRLATLATATAGEMPMKIRAASLEPPLMPNIPEMNPTASPMPDQKNVDGQACNGR